MAIVTATIRDPNGNLYTNAIVVASFVGQNTTPGAGPYVTGGVPQGQFETVVPGMTDSFGSMSIPITGNDAITPTPSTWRWTVVSNTNPTVSFAVNIQITGASQDISAALQAAAAPLFSATGLGNITTLSIVNSGNYSGTTGTFSGLLQTKNHEQMRYADQFAGSDMGAKILAAIADLGGGNGIVNARAFTGAQSAAATILVPQGVTVLLGAVTLNLAGSPGVNLVGQSAAIIGLGPGTTILSTSSGTADIVQTNSGFNRVFGCSFVSSVARTAGAALRHKGFDGDFQFLTMDKTFNGIQVTDSLAGATGNNRYRNITMGFGLASSGSWNAGILLGTVSSGTVTGQMFDQVNIQGSAAFADSFVVLDSGCDTIHFTDCQFVQIGLGDSFCLSVRNTNTSNDPQSIRFTDCVFEPGNTKAGITVSAGALVRFLNCIIATGQSGLTINGGKSTYFIGGAIGGMQQSAVVLTGGSDSRIIGNRIYDSSIQTNSGFNTIAIVAGVSDFTIQNNDFTTILSSVNQPFQNILIASGASDRYWITHNTFANFNSSGLNDGGTGTNKLVGFNSPFSSGSSRLIGVDLTQPSSLNKSTLLNSQDAAGALTGNSADQTFYTFTLPAATLAAGKGVRVRANWVHGTGTASITYKLFFGATAVINAASAVTGNGYMEAVIMNQPASTTAQRASGNLTPTGTASVVFSGVVPAENTANAIVIKATFNVANTDQVTPAQWLVELIQ